MSSRAPADPTAAGSDGPQITTIIPTYRRPRFLRRAVLSVLNQTYPRFVVRIQDNASGDDTVVVARELTGLDSRVQYHEHSQNIGGLNNIIYGIEQVTTPYFTILSDDDLLMPSFFERARGLHEAAASPLAFVSTRIVTVFSGDTVSAELPGRGGPARLSPPDGVLRCLRSGAALPGVMYRTDAMKAVGPPRTAWWNWTESGWHALAAIRFPVEFSTEVGAVFSVHPGSTSLLMTTGDFRISWFAMMEEVRRLAADAGFGDQWWAGNVLPMAYRRFLGSALRLCRADGVRHYDSLGRLAVACGLNPAIVSGILMPARLVGTSGVGWVMNACYDWARTFRSPYARGTPRSREDVSDVAAAATVFRELSRRAGLKV